MVNSHAVNGHGTPGRVQSLAPTPSGKRKRADSVESSKRAKPTRASNPKLKPSLWEDFQQMEFLESGPVFKQRKVRRSDDYTQVFLCHAYVYVFAQRFDIKSLRFTSLHKLHQNLRHCRTTKIPDIVPMI